MTNPINLRDIAKDDLPIFFEHQLDQTSNYMAAFTSKDPADRKAFTVHWTRIMNDDTIKIKTILYDRLVAGSVLSYEEDGKPEVSYWVGREYWGKGIATQALSMFLDVMKKRPDYARAAKDNIASLRVLEKCGFTITGYDKGYANARGDEIEEVIMMLK